MKLQWLKLDIDILDDNKIDAIRSLPEGDALFVLWIGLLCMAMKSANFGHVYIAEGIPYSAEALSRKLKIKESVIKLGLQMFVDMGMIQITEGGIIDILNFEKHQSIDEIERVRELNRKRVSKHRASKQLECNVTRNDSNVTVTPQIRSDKNRLDKTRQENINPAQAPKPAFHPNPELANFKRIWNKHPDKLNPLGEWTEGLKKQYYTVTKSKHVFPNDLLIAVGRYAESLGGGIKANADRFLTYNKVFPYLPEPIPPEQILTPAERQAIEKQRTDEAYEQSIIDKSSEIINYFELVIENATGKKMLENVKKYAELVERIDKKVRAGKIEYKKYKTIDEYLGGK